MHHNQWQSTTIHIFGDSNKSRFCGSPCVPVADAACIRYGTMIYMFGGRNIRYEVLDIIQMFELASLFELFDIFGDSNESRFCGSPCVPVADAACIKYGTMIYMFGGRNMRYEVLDITQMFENASLFELFDIFGDSNESRFCGSPCVPVADAACIKYGTMIYMFGSRDMKHLTMWKLFNLLMKRLRKIYYGAPTIPSPLNDDVKRLSTISQIPGFPRSQMWSTSTGISSIAPDNNWSLSKAAKTGYSTHDSGVVCDIR